MQNDPTHKDLSMATRHCRNSIDDGPFMLFYMNLVHPEEAKTLLQEYRNESYRIIKDWMKFSKIRRKVSLKHIPESVRERVRYTAMVENPMRVDHHVSDLLVSYYVFRQIPGERKKKYMEIFQKRFDVNISYGFTKDYLKVKKPVAIKKTAFIFWMNNHLKNKMSEEILEFDNFDLVLKLGNTWKNLPKEEKLRWQRFVETDERYEIMSTLKQHQP